MSILELPQHELVRLREKAKEITGSRFDYESVYSELLTRRLNGEPLQYIEEYIPFYSIQINVDSRCLIPRPETEYLIEIIKNTIVNPNKILDVGTGTGCIALMLKKIFPNSKVEGVDISSSAIELSKENSILNNLNVEFYTSNLLDSVESNDFDVIVANLPYIPTENLQTLDKEVLDYEPLIALDGGTDGLYYIKNLISQIEERDMKNLTLFLEVDVSHINILINEFSSWSTVKLEKDLVERDRFIIARK